MQVKQTFQCEDALKLLLNILTIEGIIIIIKMTGETPEVRSEKEKKNQEKTDRIIYIVDLIDIMELIDIMNLIDI